MLKKFFRAKALFSKNPQISEPGYFFVTFVWWYIEFKFVENKESKDFNFCFNRGLSFNVLQCISNLRFAEISAILSNWGSG